MEREDMNTGALLRFISILLLTGFLTTPAFAACPNGKYQSSNYLATLLEGNPLLQVSSESTEITLRNGSISLAATADLYADGNGIPFTGTGELKARGRYLLEARRGRKFIKINSVSADIFRTVMYINGVEASRQNYRSLVFGDRSIEYRCRSGKLSLIATVGGTVKTFTFDPV